MSLGKRKPKRCRNAACAVLFVPSRMGQAVCSPACAMIDAPKNQDKARKAIAQRDRREIKVRK
ncbi:recombination protein NinG, partial [Pseudomonas azerbaijanoccidens]|nr:recombination protein NinG [Pseudomonas azerbaijanoccidentalis]